MRWVTWRLCALMAVTLPSVLGAGSAAASGQPPDGRGYELVSPPEKGGADVMIHSDRTRAAVDGDAVVFPSFGAFGDARGTGVAVDYMSVRQGLPGTSGWGTHAITPLGQALTAQAVAFSHDPYFVGFTSDLSRGVFRSWRPLTSAPNVADVTNLYAFDGLRQPPISTPTLLSDSTSPLGANPTFSMVLGRPFYAGGSADLRHIIFESFFRLTPDARGTRNLYESVDGAVRLAGILPDGTPALNSQAGQGATGQLYTDTMISDDGTTICFCDISTGNIYARINGTSTVQLNESEKSAREAAQPATLWTMSRDGHRVFFTSNEGLVDGDDDSAADMYMYDFTAPAGRRLTRLSVDAQLADGHAAGGTLGVSADGRYAYFIDGGQLVAGEPIASSGAELYVWHDGFIRNIGEFADPGDVATNLTNTSWGFEQDTMTSRVTPDGRHLLFMARDDSGFRGHGGLDGYDHGDSCTFDNSLGRPCRELYLYDAESGHLACVSCGARGTVADSDALIHVRRGTGTANKTWHQSAALSADGSRVFFSTGQALVPEDSNGRYDAYEYDAETGQVRLISSGTDSSDSFFVDASASGDDVFFVTRARLVGWDVDSNYDLYDARVGGGFLDPAPSPVACSGESCQGAVATGPAISAVASSGFHGAGDLGGHLRTHRAKRCRSARRHHARRAAASRRAAKCTKRRARGAHRRARRAAGLGQLSAQRRGK